MKEIKSYTEVQIGDVAFENPNAGGVWDNALGTILWKGNQQELQSSEFAALVDDWEDCDLPDYDLVVVSDSHYGPTLFNYNNDPSGCVVFKN